jgi:hypothetical protein
MRKFEQIEYILNNLLLEANDEFEVWIPSWNLVFMPVWERIHGLCEPIKLQVRDEIYEND